MYQTLHADVLLCTNKQNIPSVAEENNALVVQRWNWSTAEHLVLLTMSLEVLFQRKKGSIESQTIPSWKGPTRITDWIINSRLHTGPHPPISRVESGGFPPVIEDFKLDYFMVTVAKILLFWDGGGRDTGVGWLALGDPSNLDGPLSTSFACRLGKVQDRS